MSDEFDSNPAVKRMKFYAQSTAAWFAAKKAKRRNRRMTAKIFYYVPKSRVQEFADLGWEAHGSLEGTHHGNHSMLMEWTRDDSPIVPSTVDSRSEART